MKAERKEPLKNFERIAVVGGGLVGLASALALQRAGSTVTLYDDAPVSPPASWGNAGHIAIEQTEPIASPKVLRSAVGKLFFNGGPADFRLRDVAAWMPWLLGYLQACRATTFAAGSRALEYLLRDATLAWERLLDAVGRPDLLLRQGHVVVWESGLTAAAGLAGWNCSRTGLASFVSVDPASLSLPSDVCRKVAGGIRFSGTSQIGDLDALLNALRNLFLENGGQLHRTRVGGISVENRRASLLLDDGGRVTGSGIVVAAGVGSRTLMRGIGHRVPLIAERGYHIEGQAGDWPEDLPPVVFEDRSMIVTRFGDRLRAASFTEFGRPASPPDPRKWERLRRHVSELGIELGEPVSQWMGARPTLPDYLPAIGVSRRVENVIYAFGHQHLGLTLAATTGEMVAELAREGVVATDKQPFDIERFAFFKPPHNLGQH